MDPGEEDETQVQVCASNFSCTENGFQSVFPTEDTVEAVERF